MRASSPGDIEKSKEFVRNLALEIEDAYDIPEASLITVVQNYKDFTAGWRYTAEIPYVAPGLSALRT